MIVAGGLVTLKPVGGVVSNNPNMSVSQADAEAKAKIEAQRQAQIQAQIDALAAKHQAQQTDKKWSVPFK